MLTRIRKMIQDDLGPAMELLALWNMQPRPEDPDAERSGIVVAQSFVAQRAGSMAGVASYLLHTPELAETASLAVAPQLRGCGIGYQLQLARLAEMQRRGIRLVRTQCDRPETIQWYVRKFGYRVVGTNPKKHAFSLSGVPHWTVLELDLRRDRPHCEKAA